MRIELDKRISSNTTGYSFLIHLYYRAKRSALEKIVFDFKNTTWFEANLSAVLGAIIELLEKSGKKVIFENVNIDLESVLRRNTFLCNYGFSYKPDLNNTIVPYKTFG